MYPIFLCDQKRFAPLWSNPMCTMFLCGQNTSRTPRLCGKHYCTLCFYLVKNASRLCGQILCALCFYVVRTLRALPLLCGKHYCTLCFYLVKNASRLCGQILCALYFYVVRILRALPLLCGKHYVPYVSIWSKTLRASVVKSYVPYVSMWSEYFAHSRYSAVNTMYPMFLSGQKRFAPMWSNPMCPMFLCALCFYVVRTLRALQLLCGKHYVPYVST
jgi:hypothetical protein